MKAVICPKYGPPEVLQIRDVPKPEPKEDQVLIKIHAAAVTASDIYIRSFNVPTRLKFFMALAIGFRGPRKKIIGLTFSGVIEEVGAKIKRFVPGDEVMGLTGFNLGAYAEYKCMKETDSGFGALAKRPTNVSHAEATSAAYGGLLALQSIEKAEVKQGDRVLIYGASGTSGTFAVQFVKHLGAHVTAVCGPKNLEFVKSLGADVVLDYTSVDAVPEGTEFDVVLDTAGMGKTSTLRDSCWKALKPGGRLTGIDDGDLKLDSARLGRVREAVESGTVKPILDTVYPFDQIVEAHRHVESTHKRGGVATVIAD